MLLCTGGIGVFIAKTGLEVTANTSFSLAMLDKLHLLLVIFGFEAGLRLISHFTKDESGQSRYPLLSPIYFCLITPAFYGFSWILGRSPGNEYFFPPLVEDCIADSLGEENCGGVSSFASGLMDIFQVVKLESVSWAAVVRSIPTLVALVLFSLIHVPINIPAFAVSSDVDVDMNNELIGESKIVRERGTALSMQTLILWSHIHIAHGYSNGLVGIFGGEII